MKRILVILIVTLIVACSDSGRPKKPDNLIPKDKMQTILYDLYIVSGAKGVNKKLLQSKGFVPETYILSKHNIDSLQFAQSNAYYAFDTDAYKTIIKSVKLRLEDEKKRLEAQVKKEDEEKKRKKDSLKEIQKRHKDSLKNIREGFIDSTVIKKISKKIISKKKT